jgi:hypothetical protein
MGQSTPVLHHGQWSPPILFYCMSRLPGLALSQLAEILFLFLHHWLVQQTSKPPVMSEIDVEFGLSTQGTLDETVDFFDPDTHYHLFVDFSPMQVVK